MDLYICYNIWKFPLNLYAKLNILQDLKLGKLFNESLLGYVLLTNQKTLFCTQCKSD